MNRQQLIRLTSILMAMSDESLSSIYSIDLTAVEGGIIAVEFGTTHSNFETNKIGYILADHESDLDQFSDIGNDFACSLDRCNHVHLGIEDALAKEYEP